MKLKTINDFVAWSYSTKTITLKTIYVDITGDLIAGLLLSQIIYWNLPDVNNKTKLRVNINDRFWLCKTRSDWYNEIRISERQYDRASKILCDELNIIDISIHRFGGVPKTHLAINFDVLLDLINKQLSKYSTKKNSFIIKRKPKANITKTKEDIYEEKVNKFLENMTEEYNEVFNMFVGHRIKIKRPMTNYAKYLIIKDLQKYFRDDYDEHIRRYKNTIKKGWQDVIYSSEKKKYDNNINSKEGY